MLVMKIDNNNDNNNDDDDNDRDDNSNSSQDLQIRFKYSISWLMRGFATRYYDVYLFMHSSINPVIGFVTIVSSQSLSFFVSCWNTSLIKLLAALKENEV